MATELTVNVENLDKVKEAITEYERRIALLREALALMPEFVGGRHDYAESCPICGGNRDYGGHAQDCLRQRALEETPKDYPDEGQLITIREWSPNDLRGLMEYIEPIWKYADCGYWKEKDGVYYISTAGWSGNEDIIAAMMNNQVWWLMFWESSTRGGHYIFCKLTIDHLPAVEATK